MAGYKKVVKVAKKAPKPMAVKAAKHMPGMPMKGKMPMKGAM